MSKILAIDKNILFNVILLSITINLINVLIISLFFQIFNCQKLPLRYFRIRFINIKK